MDEAHRAPRERAEAVSLSSADMMYTMLKALVRARAEGFGCTDGAVMERAYSLMLGKAPTSHPKQLIDEVDDCLLTVLKDEELPPFTVVPNLSTTVEMLVELDAPPLVREWFRRLG